MQIDEHYKLFYWFGYYGCVGAFDSLEGGWEI